MKKTIKNILFNLIFHKKLTHLITFILLLEGLEQHQQTQKVIL